MFVAAFFVTAIQAVLLQNSQFCKAVQTSSKSMYHIKTLINPSIYRNVMFLLLMLVVVDGLCWP